MSMNRLALPLAFTIVAAGLLSGALLTRKSLPTSGRHVALAPAISIRSPLPISGGGGGYHLPVRSELAAWAAKHTKGCGHLAGVERWKGNSVSLRLSRCGVIATFSVRRYRSTSTPRPTSIPTLPPLPTPVQPAPTVALSLPSPTPLPQTPSDYLLSLINGERASLGIAPLILNPQLSACALAHSKRMAAEGYISHDGFPSPDVCVSFSRAGQNVGQDVEPVMSGVLDDFHLMMAEGHSPLGSCLDGHDCDITYSGYRSVGLGIYDDGSRIWITETFVG